MTTDTATKNPNIIYKMKKHGDCAAQTVRVEYDRHAFFHGIMPTHDRATFEDRGEPVALITCAGCGKRSRVWGTVIRGKVNAAKGCTARCMAATSSDCECECGGEQHGINHC